MTCPSRAKVAWRFRFACFAWACSLLMGSAVQAVPIPGLYNTGVDAAGVPLPDGTIDSHYTLIANPDTGSPNAYVHDSTIFPLVAGPWIANSSVSKWIAPRINTTAAYGGSLSYTYRLTFDLTGFDPSTTTINGRWSVDNTGDIWLNGSPTGNTHGAGFSVFLPFTISGPFLSGLNTLDFIVNNADVTGGYTGLRVEGFPPPAIPEASSFLCVGVAMVVAGVVAARRRSA